MRGMGILHLPQLRCKMSLSRLAGDSVLHSIEHAHMVDVADLADEAWACLEAGHEVGPAP